MNKKGFTLAEVVGVVIIMAALALILIPVVDKQIKEGKEEIYNGQINSIKSSIDLYMNEIKLDNNESMIITLYQLKQAGLVDIDIKNPNTNKLFPNDMLITILNDNGILKYNINVESGTNTTSYETLPKMTLNSEVLEYVELGENYSVNSSDVVSVYNGISLDNVVESNIDTNKVGIYTVTYTTNYKNISNKIIKTVIVKDTKGPNVNFDTLNIPLSSAKTYDYKSDIIVSDLSGIKSIDVETNFGALKGTYSVKYIVKDNYDNETIKYRKVITS